MPAFDAEEVRRGLDEMLENVAVRAQVDQQAAQLDRIRANGTWWAALSMLATERGDTVATALSTGHLKAFLAEQDHDDLVILAGYLLHNTINLVATFDQDGDVAAAVAAMVGPEDFRNFEKFIATSGASCPDCGHDDGFTEHDCVSTNYDPFEG